MMDIDYEDEEDEPSPPWCCSSRLGVGLLACCCFMSMATQRVAMSVAMVCMVNATRVAAHPGTLDGVAEDANSTVIHLMENDKRKVADKEDCGPHPWLFPANLSLVPKDEGEFDWGERQQTVIVGTYFWGYILSQLVAGWLASRFGSRFVLGAFMLVCSTTTMLIPVATRIHYFILIMLRFVGGLGAGGVLSSAYAMWSKWAVPDERTRMVALGISGMMAGQVITYPVAAILCRVGFDGGWPSIFYILGGTGVLWSVVWIMLFHDNPLTHPRISKDERRYIVEALSGEAEFGDTKVFHTPWLTLMTSLPFLSLLICHFTFHWTFYTFETKIPLYMSHVLQYQMEQDPVVSALPYVGLWFMIIVSGVWADKLRSRGILNTGATRKIMQTVGSLCPAALLVGLGFLNCRQSTIAVSTYVVALSLYGFQCSGFFVSYLDIAPRYAGITIAITNSIGALAQMAAPALANIIITENTQEQWQTMFFISASFLVFGALCFIVCGSGELQTWAVCDEVDLTTEYSSDYSDSSSEQGVATEPEVPCESAPDTPPQIEVAPLPDTRQQPKRSSSRRSSTGKRPPDPAKPTPGTSAEPPCMDSRKSSQDEEGPPPQQHNARKSSFKDEPATFESLSESIV